MAFEDLIMVCKERIRLSLGEYPASDYPWSIKEIGGMDELLEVFKFGNWSVRNGFVFGDLAFMEQRSGCNEWLALKRDNGEWKTFDTISFYHMLETRGEDYCRDYIEHLRKTPWQDLKYPQVEPRQEPQISM